MNFINSLISQENYYMILPTAPSSQTARQTATVVGFLAIKSLETIILRDTCTMWVAFQY